MSEPLSFATIGLAPDMPPFNLSLLEVGLRSVVISVEVSWCASVWLCCGSGCATFDLAVLSSVIADTRV